MTFGHLNFGAALAPYLFDLANLAAVAVAGAAFRWLLHSASGIKNATLRTAAVDLIHAAEANLATVTGGAKQTWVVDRLAKRFPRVPREQLANTVDGVLHGLKAAGALTPPVPLTSILGATAPPPVPGTATAPPMGGTGTGF